MIKQLRRRAAYPIAVALAAGMLLVTAAPASAANTRQTWAALALATKHASTSAEAVLSDIAQVEPRNEGGHALDSTINGARLRIPTAPSTPIELSSAAGTQISVSLPKAATSAPATSLGAGLVEFDHRDGSTSAAVAKADGSLQLVSAMSGSNAPTRMAYKFDSAAGIQLTAQPDGSVVVLNSHSEPIAYVAPAWALDANGKPVATEYQISRNTLTQVIDHRSAGVRYPVVADPTITWFWWGYATKFTRAETKQVADASTNAGALAILCGLIASAPGAVLCGIGGFIVTNVIVSYIKGIYSRGHCLQINNAWYVPALFYEVTC